MARSPGAITNEGFEAYPLKTGALVLGRKYFDPRTAMMEELCVQINAPITEDDINAAKTLLLDLVKAEQSGTFIRTPTPGYQFGLVDDNRPPIEDVFDKMLSMARPEGVDDVVG